MDRKEMLITIAAQSGCSLRHVRKVLFNRATENKAIHPYIKFWKVLFDKSVNWVDRDTLKAPEKYRANNSFEVYRLPSGFVVLFYVDTNNDYGQATYGARLTLTRSFASKHIRR